MATSKSMDPLVWIDCEMTGLDCETESILSIACFVTDDQLSFFDEQGFEVIIHHDEARLTLMDEWCTRTHGKSGLIEAVIESRTTAEQAATDLLAYIRRYVPEPRKALLAGNSVHADKMFLNKTPFRPVLAHLHYRILDVSTMKEAMRRWAGPEVLQSIPKKQSLHQARDDVLESIEEARFYRRILQHSR